MPLQGGLPPGEAPLGPVVEIACDESGFSGSNLLDAATPVFTHASVDLRAEEAVGLLRALRHGLSGTHREFKAAQFLRGPRAAEALDLLLAALRGRAHVHLVDKEYFLVTRIVDLLVLEPSYAAGTRLTQDHRPAALALYRAGRRAGRSWDEFLVAFVDLVRTRRRRPHELGDPERFFRTRDALARAGLGPEATAVLDGIGRTRTEVLLSGLARDDPRIPPPLEPLLPALAETVLFWSGGQRQVLVIHDEQSALTAGRLRNLQRVLADGAVTAHPGGDPFPAGMVSPLAGLVTVDSRDDPRVQVADLLAGIARRSTSAALARALQPFLSLTSLQDPLTVRDRPG
jgi:hypothetical protein